jgi:hypothetical protein
VPHDAAARILAAVHYDAPSSIADASIVVDAPPVAIAPPVNAGVAPPDASVHVRAALDAGVVRPRTSAAKGSLAVYIRPWAEVTVDGTMELGQAPVHAKLTVGQHRVLIRNATKSKTVTVTITADHETVIDESW